VKPCSGRPYWLCLQGSRFFYPAGEDSRFYRNIHTYLPN